jgi:hypothetical protein
MAIAGTRSCNLQHASVPLWPHSDRPTPNKPCPIEVAVNQRGPNQRSRWDGVQLDIKPFAPSIQSVVGKALELAQTSCWSTASGAPSWASDTHNQTLKESRHENGKAETEERPWLQMCCTYTIHLYVKDWFSFHKQNYFKKKKVTIMYNIISGECVCFKMNVYTVLLVL